MRGMLRLLQCQSRDANGHMQSNTGVEKIMGLPEILSSQSDHRRPKEISNQEKTGLANGWVTIKGKGIGIRQIDTRGG